MIEGIVRLIPDIAENMSSIENDSFSNQLLEYPQYTKPNLVDGLSVPDVLISGNHSEVERWRRKHSLMSQFKRPDLLKNVNLSKEDDRLLQEFIAEQTEQDSD